MALLHKWVVNDLHDIISGMNVTPPSDKDLDNLVQRGVEAFDLEHGYQADLGFGYDRLWVDRYVLGLLDLED